MRVLPHDRRTALPAVSPYIAAMLPAIAAGTVRYRRLILSVGVAVAVAYPLDPAPGGFDTLPLGRVLAGKIEGDNGAAVSPVSFPVMSGIGGLIVPVGYAIALSVAYWVIRLAVRHAIKDADDRRSRVQQ